MHEKRRLLVVSDWSLRLALALASAALIVGCVASKTTPVEVAAVESSVLVGNAGGRITARSGVIEDQATFVLKVADVKPETPVEAVKPQIETIKAEAGNIKLDQADADAANILERRQQSEAIAILARKVEERDGWLGDFKIEIATRDGRWYTKIGKFVDGIAWTLGIGVKWLLYGSIVFWIVGQVVSVVVPAFFPASKLALMVSKFFTLGLPFSWAGPVIRRVFTTGKSEPKPA